MGLVIENLQLINVLTNFEFRVSFREKNIVKSFYSSYVNKFFFRFFFRCHPEEMLVLADKTNSKMIDCHKKA